MEAVRDPDEARLAAERLGFPVLLKAEGGGGGRGMRLVSHAAELPPALEAARRESSKAFGDDAVYIEKYIEGPRHVEIQILADHYDAIASLGERECSLQRRHQKMIEESPSVALTPGLRRRMGDTAIAAARAAGYVNAGTCEFLLDREGRFFFLEMNTRLQVEHPVTELVTGVDLVQWQIRIAAGERLALPSPLEPRGWAIECRITSEDPRSGFLPSSGRISYVQLPTGPGVRWDGGIHAGSDVSLHYDSLLGKLIVWAPTRVQAVSRLRRALGELRIVGVETSREFHLRVLDEPDFQRGDVSIQWLEDRLSSLVESAPPPTDRRAAAVIAALLAEEDRRSASRSANGVPASADPSAKRSDPWREAARREGLR
jgi:acetyl-CoA carboxylase biotin carboxylase subunit